MTEIKNQTSLFVEAPPCASYDPAKVDMARINNTMGKMGHYLRTHQSICVGVSGGSDSNIIVHIIATYFRDQLPKVHFVFQNTGIEYRATLRHLDFMEEHYSIHIDRVRPEKGEEVVPVVRKYGVPIVSKEFSKLLYCVQHNQPWALKRIKRTKAESPYALGEKQRRLSEYLLENNIEIGYKCCDLSKKKPYRTYLKQVKADLALSGERRAEGGQRATAHKSCYEEGHKGVDKYMPLWFWNDDTKAYYKEKEGIRYSDCYEVWGMERTGCVGCPYNSKVGRDLEKIKKYEPTCYKLCMNVFGESYRLMDKFNIHREKIFSNELEQEDT